MAVIIDVPPKNEKFKEKVERKWNDFKKVCAENKEYILTIGPAAIIASSQIIKTIIKHHGTMEEKELKNQYIYDNRNGHYYHLKRKLKNSEWREIDFRKQCGENLGDILNDMRLLK